MAAIPSTPTAVIRAELEAANVALPDDDRLAALAQIFIDSLEALRTAIGEKNQGDLSWHHVFSTFDKDGSGIITLDELTSAVRSKFKMKPSELSETEINALWCALDVNDDNSLTNDEFRRFIRRGTFFHDSGPKFGGSGTGTTSTAAAAAKQPPSLLHR